MKFKTRLLVACLFPAVITPCAVSQEKGDPPANTLRLFNTDVFGRSTTDSVVLLQPKLPGAASPETIMVDVRDDQYYAATVTYPSEISFSAARKCLNSKYGKWEKESFANDPTMGLWRNEDDHFAIQLTEDEDSLQIIYIDFSLMSPEVWGKALSEAAREICDASDQAKD